MEIEKIEVPYEILFRLHEDGSVAGCHCRYLEIIRDSETGAVFNVKELDPRPVVGGDMDAVLGLINTALTSALAVRESQLAQVNELLGLANENIILISSEKDLLGQQLNELNSALLSANELISDNGSQLALANAALIAANERIAELEAMHAGAK